MTEDRRALGSQEYMGPYNPRSLGPWKAASHTLKVWVLFSRMSVNFPSASY